MKFWPIVSLVLVLIGCGTGAGSSGTATGGSGGADTGPGGSTSSSSTSSETTSTYVDTALGAVVCKGAQPFAPTDAANDQVKVPNIPLVDESGQPLEEDGALACERFIPPSLPYAFTGWEPGFSTSGGTCGVVPDAGSFVAPILAAFPRTLSVFTVGPIDPANPSPIPLDVTIDSPADALYLCIRMRIDGVQRGCVRACKIQNGDEMPDPNALWSNTVNGVVSGELPYVDLEPLSESPTQSLADAFGLGSYTMGHVVHGHAL